MDYEQLNNGCVVMGRVGRAGRHAVEWEPEQEFSLYVQKNAKGQTCCIAIRGRDDFAEFDPRYCAEGNVLIVEDYYFEVRAVVSNPR